MSYKKSKKRYDKIVEKFKAVEKEKDVYGERFDSIKGTTSRMNNPEWVEEKECAEDWRDDEDYEY